jgi:glycosyltransferase involved in cell wall biosynthesis
MAGQEPSTDAGVRVSLVYNRAPHHAGPSGYDQIARHLGRYVATATVPGAGYDVLPGAWEWIAERSYTWMPALTGLDWYDPWAVGLEAAAARRLLRHRGEIFHFLYGEDSYRFVKKLAGVARRRGHRIVATYHQPPEVFTKVVRAKHVLDSLDGVVTLCRHQAAYFESLVDPAKVFTVPHGIDTEAYRPGDTQAVDRKLCLCVGSWLRDFTMLEAVIGRIAEAAPDVRFLLIGPEEHLAPLAELPTVTTRHGVSDDELLDAYRTAAVLVLPLTGSTANNSLLEGMASGLPVIATAVGGVPEYVDERAGVLVAPGDVAAMSEAIVAVTSDPERRDEMSRRSRESALRFEWSDVAAAMSGVYREIAKKNRPSTAKFGPMTPIGR